MTLFENEMVLFRQENRVGELLLTTHRMRYGSTANFTSIMLEDVCSIRVARFRHLWLIIPVALCSVLAVYFGVNALHADTISAIAQSENTALILGFLALAFFLAYIFSRYSVVEIASAAAAIQFEIRGANSDEVSDLVGKLESAKNERYLLKGLGGKTVADSQSSSRVSAS